MAPFDISEGKVVGCDHIGGKNKLIGEPIQDAVRVYERNGVLIAVVCDGCGSRKKSHVGSQIAVDMIPEIIADSLAVNGDIDWQQITDGIKQGLWNAACALSLSSDAAKVAVTLNETFLFTIVLFISTPEKTVIATFGDAVYALNGSVKVVEPHGDNFPAYLTYLLLDTDWPSELLRFVVQESVPTDSVESAFIGTDGLSHLIKAAKRKIPGTQTAIGALSQLWTLDQMFPNEDDEEPITTWLRQVNAEVCLLGKDTGYGVDLDRQTGPLKDDVALVSIRRRRQSRCQPVLLTTLASVTDTHPTVSERTEAFEAASTLL